MSRRGIFIATTVSLFLMAARMHQAADTVSEKTRTRAWDAVRSRVQEEKYLNHSLAVEAMMREMAVATDDLEQWALAGLVHDIDITATAGNLSRHGVVGARMLRDLGFSEAVVHAVNAHDNHAGVARTSRLDHALYCADQVYWSIIDTGLGFPSDRFKSASPESAWQQAQAMPWKVTTLGKTSTECAEIGLVPADCGADPFAADYVAVAVSRSRDFAG
jgi:putative nucleotidyltransferase with HDIG domain